MESLRSSLRRLHRDFEAEAKGWRVEVEGVRESTEEDRREAQELTGQLEALHEERDRISENIDTLNKQIGSLASDIQRTENLIAQANSVVQEWIQTFGDPPQNYEFLGAIEVLKESLGKERTSLLAQRDSLRDELAWLAAQAESQKRILELVEPLEEEHKEVACPVCKRPLTVEMVKDIRDECLQRLSEIEKRTKEKDAQLPIIDSKVHDTDARSRALVDIESKVRRILEQEPKTLSVPVLKSHLA